MRGERLLGRGTQFAAVRRALADVADRVGTSLLLRGDPGMGKTALLRAAEAEARGAGLRILRMTGAEAESGLPFAALHQVLWPLLDEAGALPVEQLSERRRHALERALGIREGAPPEEFTVGAAALTLLAHAAARGPIAVLLDDLQWADPSSVAVFGCVQRRLSALPVVAIGTTRCMSGLGPLALPDGSEAPAGQVLELRPLDDRDAGRLLDTVRPALPEEVRRRVLRAAGGNPLALRELPARLRRADGAGIPADGDASPRLVGEPPVGDLPTGEVSVGERLGRLYEDRLRGLPDGTRRLLLVATLGGTFAQREAVLREMADGGGGASWQRGREHIERAGLARIEPDSGRLVFRHP
ncbi:AAA family ATPase, partial [Streptomyces flavofungini]|uniref:AAA family ATPase n=1 Tax=Streptomyces flavofungini TaxID=68200 RepID=UPI0034DFDE3C